MERREILVSLLRNYRLAESTSGRSGEKGSGDYTPQMPVVWNESFRELERCLGVLSREVPGLARTLLARYVDPTVSRRRLIGARAKDGSVRFVNQPPRSEVTAQVQLPDRGHANEWDVRLASWPDWVYANRVDEALDRLEELFRGQAWLPTEMLDLAA